MSGLTAKPSSTPASTSPSVDPPKPRNYYFDNAQVERLLTRYVQGGCIEVKLRNEIMSHAMELIRQIIRTHNLHIIYPGRNQASFYDLVQVAWCVVPETLVFTKNGIERIGDVLASCKMAVGSGVSVLKDAAIFGEHGLRQATSAIDKSCQTRYIQTKCGYNLQASLDHPVLTLGEFGPEWVKCQNLKPGMLVAIQSNQQCFGRNDSIINSLKTCGGTTHLWQPPAAFNESLAYLIGLILSEGSIERYRVVIYTQRPSLARRILSCGRQNRLQFRFEGGDRCVLNSVRFVEFLEQLGLYPGIRAWGKAIPERILSCSKPIVKALLQGMFDGDGHSNRRTGCVGYTSTSSELIEQLRILLLNFGVVTKTSIAESRLARFKKYGRICESMSRTSYQLLASTENSKTFYKEIGFRIAYKQRKMRSLSKASFQYVDPLTTQRAERAVLSSGLSRSSLHRKYNIRFGKKTMTFLTLKKIRDVLQAHGFHDQYIEARIKEHFSPGARISWLPVTANSPGPFLRVVDVSIPDSKTLTTNGIITHNCQIESVLYKFVPGKAKVFNMWSQIAKTVILAHIKKETRDKKNATPYSGHLNERHKNLRYAMMNRFVLEASGMFKYNPEYSRIIKAIDKLCAEDDRPHDGLIGKLAKRAQLSKAKVSSFIRLIRLNGHSFTDSGMGEKSRHFCVRHSKAHYENVDDEED